MYTSCSLYATTKICFIMGGNYKVSSDCTFTLWYCSAVNFSVQMGATGTQPRIRAWCCKRKGREYIPLRDGLITTTRLRLSCSHTSFRKPAGASSPTGAGASADLDWPSPVSRQTRQKKTSGGEEEKTRLDLLDCGPHQKVRSSRVIYIAHRHYLAPGLTGE